MQLGFLYCGDATSPRVMNGVEDYSWGIHLTSQSDRIALLADWQRAELKMGEKGLGVIEALEEKCLEID
jgi:hypothetical protein